MSSEGGASSAADGATAPRGLPRRDYVVIPLLILGTISLLLAAAEIGSRLIWPAYADDTCVRRDRLHTPHPVPNCSTRDKIPEGPWLSYDYNACGYRTPDPCGPKPDGVRRVVFLGSSITQGYHVPYDKTFAAITTRMLAEATGQVWQNENLAYEGMSPLQTYRKLPEALALKPDLVIFAVSPFDLEEKTDPAQLAARNDPDAHFDRPSVTIYISPLKRIGARFQASRTAAVAQHYIFSNTDTYLRLSLSRGDKTDYLRDSLTPAWQDRLDDFNLILTDMARRLHDAGIPLVVVMVPSHQVGALLSSSQQPPHTDPFAFGRTVGALVEKAGALYVDGTKAMGAQTHSDLLFYLSESHLNADGHAVIARELARKLETSVLPALSAERDH